MLQNTGIQIEIPCFSVILVVCALIFGSCTTVPISLAEQGQVPKKASGTPEGLYRNPEIVRLPLNADERQLVASSKLLLSQPPNAKVTVNGRKFNLDCIGTVSAIFWNMNIDIQKDFAKYTGNGVSRLYQSLAARGTLHADTYPRPGDVIFWDNTWDANGDGNRTNDPRTHAGIVIEVDDDGTIHYIHENYIKGVTIEAMNLLNPAVPSDAAGKRINNSMAISTVTGGPKPGRFLAGDVFGRFGDVLTIKKELLVIVVDIKNNTSVRENDIPAAPEFFPANAEELTRLDDR